MGMAPSRSSPVHSSVRTLSASRDCVRATSCRNHKSGGNRSRRRTPMRIRSSLAVRLPRLLPPTRYVMLRVVLLASVGLIDLLLMSQQRDMAIGMRGDDSGHIVMWLLTCRLLPIATSCAGTLIILRMVRSARRQRTQTLAALRPLLAQPPLTAPPPVVPFPQSLQLQQ